MAVVKKRDRMLVRRGSDCHAMIEDVHSLDTYFHDISHLGTGRFSDVALVRCKKSNERVALKIFPKTEVKYIDFIREYNYSYFLAPHHNIVNTFEGLFATPDLYYFVQEYCPTASLREAVYQAGGLSEEFVRTVLLQMISALQFMHDEGLVHRNLRAKNVLVFDPDKFERIKITDLALTRRHSANVKNIDKANEYHAPELCDVLVKETVKVDSAVDVWAVGIIVYFALISKYPWQVARPECKPFADWDAYIRRKSNLMPPKWGRFTEKGQKIFRKCLKTKHEDRIAIKDLKRYVTNEKWVKAQMNKSVSAQSVARMKPSRNPRKATDQTHVGNSSKSKTHQHEAREKHKSQQQSRLPILSDGGSGGAGEESVVSADNTPRFCVVSLETIRNLTSPPRENLPVPVSVPFAKDPGPPPDPTEPPKFKGRVVSGPYPWPVAKSPEPHFPKTPIVADSKPTMSKSLVSTEPSAGKPDKTNNTTKTPSGTANTVGKPIPAPNSAPAQQKRERQQYAQQKADSFDCEKMLYTYNNNSRLVPATGTAPTGKHGTAGSRSHHDTHHHQKQRTSTVSGIDDVSRHDEEQQTTEKTKKSKSALQQFISNTLATMTEISEQVVSAQEQ